MFALHRAGGRVKTAGLGLDPLFPEEADGYARDPSPERAALLRAAIGQLQSNPPPRLLATFFPQERNAIRGFLSRSGLYRPFLKTDQGPAGIFLPFVTGDGEGLRTYRVTNREGVAIPEVHLASTLRDSADARRASDRVRAHYRRHELEECSASLGDLSTHVGFRSRKADVGRGLFFFCNAAATDALITIPSEVCGRVERIVNELVERALAKASHARAKYRGGAPLHEALASAQGDRLEAGPELQAGLYLQGDVYLGLDGTITINQVQLPDVGLFLTELPSEDHVILPQVQEVVGGLRARTQELLATLPSPTWLLTRESVVRDGNDTLEHLEIQALRKMAAEAGLDLRVTTPSQVDGLPAGAQILLLNVDPAAPDCEPLLRRTSRGEIACTPDPFFKLFYGELTTERRIAVRGKELELFMEAIRPGRSMTPGGLHAIHQGIERVYKHAKFTADILHVEVPGERTLVPTLRHSVHSFTSLYARCARHGFPDLFVREVPIDRGSSFLHGEWGPHLCALRFYFSRV
ncbi:MAG: hypothetical protein AVDCRST_MAG68-4246 [uncultured Gemmatimonadetes bacterium]|uniref:Uncharacterized protein n=1 Tax=uncultured Gemmatimonadota bacterium TaxID=203437 RepID=A0A6J4MIS7_9BACT|nr:MAG: hypothetical protein AVDCRST_MAG68-4246 [uncultured Gemmatimonadota bacterium]